MCTRLACIHRPRMSAFVEAAPCIQTHGEPAPRGMCLRRCSPPEGHGPAAARGTCHDLPAWPCCAAAPCPCKTAMPVLHATVQRQYRGGWRPPPARPPGPMPPRTGCRLQGARNTPRQGRRSPKKVAHHSGPSANWAPWGRRPVGPNGAPCTTSGGHHCGTGPRPGQRTAGREKAVRTDRTDHTAEKAALGIKMRYRRRYHTTLWSVMPRRAVRALAVTSPMAATGCIALSCAARLVLTRVAGHNDVQGPAVRRVVRTIHHKPSPAVRMQGT